MPLDVIDSVSRGATSANEDRAGAEGPIAWVIDGATDVLAEPLIGDTTDSAWYAERLNAALIRRATAPMENMHALPASLAEEIATEFFKHAKRHPREPHEHPSAAAIVIRANDSGLDVLSLGDCALMAETNDGFVHRNVGEASAGDHWVSTAIADHHKEGATSYAEARAALWPKLRQVRNLMNTEGGYGIFSVIPTPNTYVNVERLNIGTGATILLASDGLTRLVDVFQRYTLRALFEAAGEWGLDALLTELRELEAADPDCRQFPRAKVNDDATGLLLKFR